MEKIWFFSILLGIIFVILLLQNQYSEPFDIKTTSGELKIQACSISGIELDDSVSEVLEIRTNLLELNPRLGIKQMIEELSDPENNKQFKDETQNTMIKNAIYISLPWTLLLFLALIFYFLDLFCLSESCPPCNACKFKKAEKVDELKLVITFGIIISIVVLGICVAGIVVATQMHDNLNSIRCAMVSLYSDVNDGTAYSSDVNVQKWKGLIGLDTQLTQIISKLADMIIQTDEIIAKIDAEQLQNDYKDLVTQNGKLNKEITYSTGKSYYQSNSALSYIQDGTNTEQNAFVTSKLSIITPQTQLFDEIYKNILAQVSSVKENGKSISNDQAKIKNALDTGKQKVNDWTITFNKYTQDMFESSQSLYLLNPTAKNNVDQSTLGLSLIFCIVGLFVLFSLLATLGIYLSKSNMECCKNILCCTCSCYLLGLIICLIVCIVLSVTNAVLAESCQYFDDLTTVQANFQSSNLFASNKEISDIFNECFFKDGDILNIFNVNETVAQIQKLDSSISAFSEAQTSYNTAISKGKTNLNTNKQFIQDFVTFKRIDYVEPTDGEATNIKYIMKERFKDCKKISVIESQSNCETTSTFYDSSTERTFPTATEKLCLQSSVFSFQNTKLQDLLSGCSQTTADLNEANQFYQQQSTAWGTPLQSEKDIITKHESNQQNLNSKLQAITDYSNQVSVYLKSITDKNTGLIGSTNCKFAKTSVSNFTNTLCVRQLKFSYIMWVFYCVISCGLLLSHFYFMRIILGVNNIQRSEKNTEHQNLYIDPNQIELNTAHYQGKKPQLFLALHPEQLEVKIAEFNDQQAINNQNQVFE